MTDRLLHMLGEHAEIGRLSGPLKKAYADEHNLDYKELLSDGPYKEKYRADMITWGERRRQADPGFFAKLVLKSVTRPVLIVSDARRQSDMDFFTPRFNTITVRVSASPKTREDRGYHFKSGVDDAESECGLDHYVHDVQINNDGDDDALRAALAALDDRIRAHAGLYTGQEQKKYVLVTGANKGIGLAICRAALAACPECHVFLGSRDLSRGEDARRELGEDDRVTVVALDVTDPRSVNEAMCNVRKVLGRDRLHGIVNNAGVAQTSIQQTIAVNMFGSKRVVESFLPLLKPNGGRIVFVSSAAGPVFVSKSSKAVAGPLTDPVTTWPAIERVIDQCVALAAARADPSTFKRKGYTDGAVGDVMWAYGFSKACLNAYSRALARLHPELIVNSCTPGFIETDMTKGLAAKAGRNPSELGMKPPMEGTKAPLYLLLGDVDGSGLYYGSDAKRSPLDMYRNPGDPEHTGPPEAVRPGRPLRLAP